MKLEIEVGAKSLDAITGLGRFIKTVKEATADGFQPGDDIPDIATAAFTDLLPLMSGFEQVKKEIQDAPDTIAILVALLANDLIEVFK